MHRRAARTLIAALAAAFLVAPASAGAYTFDIEPAPEGDAVEVTVTAELGEPLGFTVTPVGIEATAGTDFDGSSKQAVSNTPFTIPTVEDDLDEDDESLAVRVGNDQSPAVEILDDDNPPALSIGDATAPENEPFKLTITAANRSENPISIPLSANGGADLRVPGAVTLPAGERSVDVPLEVVDDFEDEVDEAYAVTLGTPSGATLADGEGVVTIVNDDLRVVDVFDAGTLEGSGGGTSIAQFIVRLNAPTFRTVDIRFTTGDGNARAPVDYLGKLGVVRFVPGQTVATVDVAIVADDASEPTESFALWLTGVDGARFGDAVAVGVITDDDGPASEQTADTTPPRMRLSAPKASGRKVSMRVTCPSGERRCAGRVTFFSAADRRSKARTLRRERRLGAASFRLSGGRSKTVAITVPSSIAGAARRAGRLKVQAFTVTEDASGNVDTRTARATLRYRKRASK